MAEPIYKFDSLHKRHIRTRWVEFIRDVVGKENDGARLITFPSNELQELILYEKEGLIRWEKTETDVLRITKGEVICFEKDHTKWRELKEKLPFATVEKEFGYFLTSNATAINKGKIKIFPVDAINLDYEKNISKNETSLDVIFELIFQFQSKHKKDFSFFLTWPQPIDSNDDDPNFIDGLKRIISDNLEDLNASEFKKVFEEKQLDMASLPYEILSVAGITKKVLKKAAQHGYQLTKREFYNYGEKDRQKMISTLYLFKHVGNLKSSTKIYSEDVVKSLQSIIQLYN